jgi:type IV pilus assembly protein PilB
MHSTQLLQQRRVRLGEQLITDGLINEQQLRQALEQQRQTGAFLGETLISLGYLTTRELGPFLQGATGFPFVDLAEVAVNSEVVHTLSEAFCRRKRLIPFALHGEEVHIAMADPLDLATVDDLRARLDRKVQPFLALKDDLEAAINRAYSGQHKFDKIIEEMAKAPLPEPDITVDELMGLAEDRPIIQLVNSIVDGAIQSGASDIHIEPQEFSVRLRYRIDGLLYDQSPIPKHHQAAVVSRIKIISMLNIAERRRPQDGRFSFKDNNGNDFDLRISVMPMIYGEKVVMRVLEKASSFATVDKLGFLPDQRTQFEQFIRRPHGILLVTGPTGSGKSTTLYGGLQKINDATLNINTIEDPVEYHLKGINQVNVNPKIGFTFANGLRTLVRQDPDVIMVGEIRDLETAEIAVQAALTGHLVLSTLHTNDAPGAVTRLQNMGVEPFLISSAVIGVLAQRLLRTVCPHCKETRVASPAMIEAFGLPMINGQAPIIATGRGCAKCGNRGMRGRTAVYEIMPITESIRDLILKRAPSSIIRGQAIAEGMVTMRDAAVHKVMDGMTTPEEVARVLYAEE